MGWIIVALGFFVLGMMALSAAKARHDRTKLPLDRVQCVCRRKEYDDEINTLGVTRKQYYVTFESENDHIRCNVPYDVFEAIEIGQKGVLEHRGATFVTFNIEQ